MARAAVARLLTPAAAGGWPVERRLLYELQRACLAVERTNYTVDVLEWMRSLGRRRLKRPLPKTRWVKRTTGRRRRSATPTGYWPGSTTPYAGCSPTPSTARTPGPAPTSGRTWSRSWTTSASCRNRSPSGGRGRSWSRSSSTEPCRRGFLRVGDLRDAIARNRVKLPDLRGPGELVRGDPLIRANDRLAVRLDGVYRRGEVYMRLLQRGCSVFFGTRPGRWFSKTVALPFGGAFILLEALGHLYEAGEGVVHWLSGWTTTVNGHGLLGGAPAAVLAANPRLDPGGVRWEAVLVLGVFLLLLIHSPAFRARVAAAARFAFVKVPRAVRRSPLIYRLVHNRMTRFFRRHLLLPAAAGGTGAAVTGLLGGDATSVGLVGGGLALLAGTFFRTPFGRGGRGPV